MLTKLKGFYRSCKKYFTIKIIAVIVAISCMGYMNYKINYTAMVQHNMLVYLKNNSNEQQQEKIRNHAIAIQQKISDYESVGNEYVDQYVLTAYQSARELALMGDNSCYFVESVGDEMLKAYALGMVDGKKVWNNTHKQL